MYTANSAFKWVFRDDGAYIYCPISGDVKIINETGAIIVKSCSNRSVGEIASLILEEFEGISYEEAIADVEEFLEGMVKEGYLCPKSNDC